MNTATNKNTGSRITQKMLQRSHKAQFLGQDYQRAAHEIFTELSFEPNEDEISELESSPEPWCECGFCANAPWE